LGFTVKLNTAAAAAARIATVADHATVISRDEAEKLGGIDRLAPLNSHIGMKI
jgi:hypothetical protein